MQVIVTAWGDFSSKQCQIAYELSWLNDISFMVRVHFVQLLAKDTSCDGSPLPVHLPGQANLDREEFHMGMEP
jgi:hypothetical protein